MRRPSGAVRVAACTACETTNPPNSRSPNHAGASPTQPSPSGRTVTNSIVSSTIDSMSISGSMSRSATSRSVGQGNRAHTTRFPLTTLAAMRRRKHHPAREGPMALFLVRHQHDAEQCPATDPYMGATLLNYLSRPSVREHGVEIRGEAVVQGEHTLYMIVESGDEALVREFMQPFAMAGSVDVYPASTCARVVASGGCAA